jgi:hypothetical protein
MDTGTGRFAEITKEIDHQVVDAAQGNTEAVPIFRIGETVVIRGAKFEIRNLDAFTGIVTMKLLPRNGVESLKRSAGE